MFSHIKIGYQQWKKKDLCIDDGLCGIKVIDGIYYYEWEAAMRVASQVKGYHIPTHEEFMKAIELCKCKYEPCEQIWNFSYTGIESFKKKFGFIPGAGYEFGHSAYTISGIQVDTGFISKDWARYWCSDLAKDTETTMSRAHHVVTITDKDDIWVGRASNSMCYRVRLIKDNDVVETCGLIHTIERCINKLKEKKTMSELDLTAFKAEVKSLICSRLCKDTNAMWMASQLVKEYDGYIQYVAKYFPTDHKESNKCAVGILAMRDSQVHPDKYKKYDMTSGFDVHFLSRLILEDEDAAAISQLEDDIIAELNKE